MPYWVGLLIGIWVILLLFALIFCSWATCRYYSHTTLPWVTAATSPTHFNTSNQSSQNTIINTTSLYPAPQISNISTHDNIQGLSPNQVAAAAPLYDPKQVKQLVCSICLDEISHHDTTRIIRHCQHVFHSICIRAWLTRVNTCPNCQSIALDPTDLDTTNTEYNYDGPSGVLHVTIRKKSRSKINTSSTSSFNSSTSQNHNSSSSSSTNNLPIE